MKVYKSLKAEKRIWDTYDALLGEWKVAYEERDILTSYGTTHVIQWGCEEGKPPLVLFQGVGDDSALMWLYNAEALSRHFNLFAVDTLGGPGKSRPNEKYGKGFNDIVWVDEVLAGLGLDRTNMAGVSNGAYLTQYYGVHRPEKVLKLLCMAGSVPVGEFGSMKTIMKVFLPEALFPSQRNAERLLRKLSGDNAHVFLENPKVVGHYFWLLKGFNNMAMRFHSVRGFIEEEIEIIREKTLYLIGEEDPFAKLGGKEALIQHGMNARFFPGVGHGINHEIAGEINQIMISYLLT